MSTTGNKGKFSDKLRLISLFRRKMAKHEQIVDIIEEDNSKIGFGIIIKKAILLPITVIASKIERTKINEFIDNKNINELEENVANNCNDSLIREKHKVIDIKNINVSLIKKIHDTQLKSNDNRYTYNEKETNINELEKNIINLIKKKLIKSINELEIIQSDLFVLNEIDSSKVYLDRCQDGINDLRKMISRIKELKEKYDYLKDNFDFEYLLGLDDNILADKIIELKNMCESSQIISFVKDYKLLDEYKYLYLKIEKIKDESDQCSEYLELKKEELKKRDIDFEKFKEQVFTKNRVNEKYEAFIKQQQELVNELNGKVSKIESFDNIHYRLRGFDRLLSNSFKFFGLILLTPFRGLIPSIASQTLLTKAEIKNLRNNLKWEESHETIYKAIDYSSELKSALSDLDDTGKLVDSTLEDIVRLKAEFNDKFKKYKNDFSEYRDVINKLNKAENAILGNKIKLNVVREKVKEQELVNKNKMTKIKVLRKET